MNFLICPVTLDQIDNGDYDIFVGQNGEAYNFLVEFEEDEMICITDTVGRSLPVDINDLSSLINILTKIERFQTGKAKAKEILINELLRGTTL